MHIIIILHNKIIKTKNIKKENTKTINKEFNEDSFNNKDPPDAITEENDLLIKLLYKPNSDGLQELNTLDKKTFDIRVIKKQDKNIILEK